MKGSWGKWWKERSGSVKGESGYGGNNVETWCLVNVQATEQGEKEGKATFCGNVSGRTVQSRQVECRNPWKINWSQFAGGTCD